MSTKTYIAVHIYLTTNILTACTKSDFSVRQIDHKLSYLIDYKGVHIVHISKLRNVP
jgi:hypothetical protein